MELENKLININGLCRSGNHAIIFWILHNISSDIELYQNDILGDNAYFCKNYKVFYINNINHLNNQQKSLLCDIKKQYKYFICSYEDIFYQNSIYIIRDFLNLIASRYKAWNPKLCYHHSYCCELLDIIKIWKQMISMDSIIIYNRWLDSKEYRDKIMKTLLNTQNINDNINYIPTIGGGSSFTGVSPCVDKSLYIKRINSIKLPEEIINTILNDHELIDLNIKFFNTNIPEFLRY